MRNLNIVKIGGNIIDCDEDLEHFIKVFSALKEPKILVHGGGKLATDLSNRLGVLVKMHQGRRITDAASLEIATMVYAGRINKHIVAKLQGKGCNAFGLSGADANTITAVKRSKKDLDYGYVGDISSVQTTVLEALLSSGVTPVFCPITHDRYGQLLNTNADTIASELAIAFSKKYKVELRYCFEHKGVLSDLQDSDSVIKKINKDQFDELSSSGAVHSGMLPKIHNCFYALQKGVHAVHIGQTEMLNNPKTIFTTLSIL